MGDSFPTTIKLPGLRYRIGEEPKNKTVVVNFDYITKVKSIMSVEEYDRVKASFLGPLLKLGSRGLAMSGKMVHCLLCRSLITTRKNEIWVHFGAQPMRFSIREFHMVTGLKCSPWASNVDAMENLYDWAATKEKHSLDELVQILRETNADAEDQRDERFSLAMVILIESILLQKYTNYKFPAETLKLAQHVNILTNHPWGRDAYKILLESIKRTVSLSLSNPKYDLHGFPLAFHLWILESIPAFQSAYSRASLTERPSAFICEKYTHTDSPTIKQLERLESADNLKVICILPSIPDDPEDEVALEEDTVDSDLSQMVDCNGFISVL